tara:strand:- start:5408 stop:7072 length:1665 start_codon:yes stop_codon:yes gene_type:complete
MIKQNKINYLILLLIALNILGLTTNYIEALKTWCFFDICSNIELVYIIFIFFIFLFTIVHNFFEKLFPNNKLNLLLFIPLVLSNFDAKGNEAREFGLSYMLSNKKEFLLEWNGNVYTEQLFFINIFSKIALLFDEFLHFLYFSRALVFVIFVFSIIKFLETNDSLKVVFVVYFSNFISLTFGGEYLLSGASPRTLAYSFAFLSIYFLKNNSKYFYLFSIISALFHIHVYLYLIIPFLFFGDYRRDFKKILLFSVQSLTLLIYLFTADYFFPYVSQRSSFLEKLTQKYNDEYVSSIIASEIIPFHVMPFNFSEGDSLINTYWVDGFINFFIIIILFITLIIFKKVSFEKNLIIFYIIHILFALLVAYLDRNSILSFLYLFKPVAILSLLLAINSFGQISRNLVKVFIGIFIVSWVFYFPVKYLNYSIQIEKYELITENSIEDLVVVVDSDIRKFFPSNFINDNYEEYIVSNNEMGINDIILREKLEFNSNSFCKELSNELNLMVISSKKLDCSQFSLFSVNKYYGNSGIVGDPYYVYKEDSCNLEDSCFFFYTNY